MSSGKPKAICLHGFLGSTDDFAVLGERFEVFSLDLKPVFLSNEKIYESWKQLIHRIKTEFLSYLKTFDKEDQVFIFSYSMGSKVLFSLFEDLLKSEILEKFNKRPKIALISTHFGIYETDFELQQELSNRQQMDSRYLNLLDGNDLSFFIEAWNSLALFAKDITTQTDWSIDQIKHYFKQWSQSQSKNKVSLLKSNFIFLIFHGAEDIKYKQQSDRLKAFNLAHVNHFEFQARSHRLLSEDDLNLISKKALGEF